MRADTTPPDKRLADNMLDYNPAATDALVQLMLGALVARPRGRPAQRPAALLRSGAAAGRRARRRRRARVGARRPAHGRHAGQPRARPSRAPWSCRAAATASTRSTRSTWNGRTSRSTAATSPCTLAPGAGAKLTLAMQRYANPPDRRLPLGPLSTATPAPERRGPSALDLASRALFQRMGLPARSDAFAMCEVRAAWWATRIWAFGV